MFCRYRLEPWHYLQLWAGRSLIPSAAVAASRNSGSPGLKDHQLQNELPVRGGSARPPGVYKTNPSGGHRRLLREPGLAERLELQEQLEIDVEVLRDRLLAVGGMGRFADLMLAKGSECAFGELDFDHPVGSDRGDVFRDEFAMRLGIVFRREGGLSGAELLPP